MEKCDHKGGSGYGCEMCWPELFHKLPEPVKRERIMSPFGGVFVSDDLVCVNLLSVKPETLHLWRATCFNKGRVFATEFTFFSATEAFKWGWEQFRKKGINYFGFTGEGY